jgi:catechol 2,3-dioxygenase-like lactoylglutathione lyase family enzyme
MKLNDSKTFSSFSVKDLQNAKKFYGETLGLDVKDTPEGLGLAGGKVFVYRKPNHQPATFTVLNFPVDNIDSAVADLKKRGVQFESYDMPDLKTGPDNIARDGRGPKIAWFKDPDGNIVSVLEGMGS